MCWRSFPHLGHSRWFIPNSSADPQHLLSFLFTSGQTLLFPVNTEYWAFPGPKLPRAMGLSLSGASRASLHIKSTEQNQDSEPRGQKSGHRSFRAFLDAARPL